MKKSEASEAEARRRAARGQIANSAEAAQKLLTVGMKVIVVLDDGSEEKTTTRSQPWPLSHGAWVIHLESRSCYSCHRVRPDTGSDPK